MARTNSANLASPAFWGKHGVYENRGGMLGWCFGRWMLPPHYVASNHALWSTLPPPPEKGSPWCRSRPCPTDKHRDHRICCTPFVEYIGRDFELQALALMSSEKVRDWWNAKCFLAIKRLVSALHPDHNFVATPWGCYAWQVALPS